MDRKAKGSNAERELQRLLWNKGWYSIRAAGSGSSRYPSPDLVCGNGVRRMAIECKATSGDKRYITKEQIDELANFARMFNAEPWVAFRCNADWYFVALDDLHDSGKNLLVSEDIVRNKGLLLDEVIK